MKLFLGISWCLYDSVRQIDVIGVVWLALVSRHPLNSTRFFHSKWYVQWNVSGNFDVEASGRFSVCPRAFSGQWKRKKARAGIKRTPRRYSWFSDKAPTTPGLSTYHTNGRGGHQIDEKRFATRHHVRYTLHALKLHPLPRTPLPFHVYVCVRYVCMFAYVRACTCIVRVRSCAPETKPIDPRGNESRSRDLIVPTQTGRKQCAAQARALHLAKCTFCNVQMSNIPYFLFKTLQNSASFLSWNL